MLLPQIIKLLVPYTNNIYFYSKCLSISASSCFTASLFQYLAYSWVIWSHCEWGEKKTWTIIALQFLSRSDIWHFYSHSTGQVNLGISRARVYNRASGAKQEEEYEYLSNINKTYHKYVLTYNKYINFVFR